MKPSLLLTRIKKALIAKGLTAKPRCLKCRREVELHDLGRGGLCGVCSPRRLIHYI